MSDAPTTPEEERPLLRVLLLGPRRERLNLATRLELLLFIVVLGLAIGTSPTTDDGRANAPFMGSLDAATGGGICIYKRATGYECGGCGMTRAFVQLGHAQVRAAVALNPISPILFAWVCWRTIELLVLNLSRRRLRLALAPRWQWTFYGLVVLGFGVLFMIRLVQGAMARFG